LAVRIAIDTNAYRRFADGDHAVLEHIRSAERLALPIPVIAELRAGFALGTRGAENERTLSKFVDSPRVELLSCDEQTTHHYAALFAQLRRQGTPIPIMVFASEIRGF
jgi:tRNA(fMet)-specific endonuclease VapC